MADTNSKAQNEAILYSIIFKAQLDASPDGILAVDEKGKTLLFNKKFGEMWGIPKEVLDTKNDEKMLQFVASMLKDPDAFVNKVQGLYERKQEKSLDEVVFKDGRVFERYSFPLNNENGQCFGRIWYFRDISKRISAEKKYQQLVDNLQEGIWAIDKDSNTTFVNPRMAEMLGYTVAEMMGKPLFYFMDEQGKKIAQMNVERRKQGIKEQHDFEFIKKDGTRIYTRLETSPITNEKGEYTGAIAAIADITANRIAEKKLAERSEELERLNKAMVNREIKMIELKEELKKLKGDK